MSSCHQIDEYTDNPRGNFDALWHTIDTRYCFFDQKGVDWNDVYTRYSVRISESMSNQDLFTLMSEMIDELRDGHTNLSTPFASSYYRAWWSDYPQNYNARIIEQYYFNFHYLTLGPINYGILPNQTAYMHYSSFEMGLGDGNIDYLLRYFSEAPVLIIDVRDNGGGNLTNVDRMVSHFISQPITAGYILHKTGPGHNDFSKPYAYTIQPAGAGNLLWTQKPVIILTNRSTFSAANNFVSIMKSLPHVTVVGSTTGGGSGMPYSSTLPNGWGIRLSAVSILDATGHVTEFGVEPTTGHSVDISDSDIAAHRDPILDHAMRLAASL